MPFKIKNIYFNSSLFDSTIPIGETNSLNANIQDKINIRIELQFENTNVMTPDNAIYFAPVSLNSAYIDDLVYIKNQVFVKDLKVGDEIEFISTGTSYDDNYYITEIIDSNYIRVVLTTGSAPTFTGTSSGVGYIANRTFYKSVKYDYNFVQSGTSFNSLVDNSLQELYSKNIDSLGSATNLIFSGKTDYQIGNATITYNGIDANGIHTYILDHETYLTPFFLYNELTDLQNDKAPTYYLNGACLNYINSLRFARDWSDFANARTVQYIGNKSNTGWYNESFNGGENGYYINSLSIVNDATSNIIDSLELNNLSIVSIQLKSSNSTFITDDTIVRVGFNYLPNQESLYQSTGNDLRTNFQFDNIVLNTDDVYVNGTYNATVNQIIKRAKATFINTSTINLTIEFELGTDAKSIITQNDNYRYLISVSTEDINLDVADSDRVNLLAQVSEFMEELQQIDLVTEDIKFIQHPYNDGAYGEDTIDIMPVDDVAVNGVFYIDYTDLQNDNFRIVSVNNELVLTHATQSDVVLESEIINCESAPLMSYAHSSGGYVDIQDISFFKQRSFKIPDEIRRNIVFCRDNANDDESIDKYYFALNYPFMMRWEYWEQLLISQKSSDFYDGSLDYNGYNHNWYRLASQVGWSFKYRCTFKFRRKGILYEQVFEKSLTPQTFSANTDYTSCVIESSDINTNTDLENGGNWYVKGYENTTITATFNKTSGTTLDLADVCIVIWIETFEQGGINDIRRISSVHDNDSKSWFVENLVTVTEPTSQTFVGTCTLDSTKLPVNTQYTIYARLYEMITVANDDRITNDDILRITMDGYNRKVI